jgi:hypothetical protein
MEKSLSRILNSSFRTPGITGDPESSDEMDSGFALTRAPE